MTAAPATGSLPPGFVRRMERLLGAEAEALVAALLEPPQAGLRINRLKTTPDEVAAALSGAGSVGAGSAGLEPVPWCADGFVLDAATAEAAARHPFHAAGLYYLQDPAAMAPAAALAPAPGQWAIDLAAAPGGKSTQLASRLGDRGLLVANDVHGGRARALSQNLERWGARNVLLTNSEPELLAARWPAQFERVLLDAPCSGEGMFRKSAAARQGWSEAQVLGCARRQDQLLAAAAALVRPGGLLVYSTCTFAPEENEDVVARFLAAHEQYELVPLALPGTAPGRGDWLAPELQRDAKLVAAVRGCARLWPHRGPGDGHFVALLQRLPSKPEGGKAERAVEGARASVLPPASRKLLDGWRAFVAEALTRDPFAGRPMSAHRETLLALPTELPPLERVRLVRAGVPLGGVGRPWQPSHALALTLAADDARQRLELPPESAELAAYLAGAELERAGPDGWLLVTCGGHPLGWGRRARGIVKNQYPKGLRRR